MSGSPASTSFRLRSSRARDAFSFDSSIEEFQTSIAATVSVVPGLYSLYVFRSVSSLSTDASSFDSSKDSAVFMRRRREGHAAPLSENDPRSSALDLAGFVYVFVAADPERKRH